jgi:hypothetical protein
METNTFFRYVVLSLILISIISQCVSAGGTTQILNANTSGYYNLSVNIHEDAYIPWDIWFCVACLGVVLLVLSILTKPEQGNDILGIMAVLPLAWASWGALQIVFIHSGVFAVNDPIITNQTNVFMMTQYDIYHEVGLALIFLAFTIIALVNLYRILVLNRTRDKEVTPPGGERENPDEYDEGQGVD